MITETKSSLKKGVREMKVFDKRHNLKNVVYLSKGDTFIVNHAEGYRLYLCVEEVNSSRKAVNLKNGDIEIFSGDVPVEEVDLTIEVYSVEEED